MRIAVDAMGGDFAPAEVVAGAWRAAQELAGLTELLLVGQEDAIRAAFPPGPIPPRLRIVPAAEVIGMEEAPAIAVRRKRDSSINRMADLVKAGEADAMFSAGNTGAVVAAATLKLRTLEGVLRPAIATIMPTRRTPFVLIDAGANTDSTPAMLRQFAVMGAVYAREILGIANPLVGLLSIGGEESKGNETTKETLTLLRASRSINFHGNVEGHDLYEGRVDVVVCDGFVGNVVLKTSESVAHFIGEWLRQEFTRNPLRMLGAALLRGALNEIRRKSDPAAYGGAPLLGANGVVIIGHSASRARAVFNAIRVAGEAVAHRINPLITAEIARAEAA